MDNWTITNTPTKVLVYNTNTKTGGYYPKSTLNATADSGHLVLTSDGTEVMRSAWRSGTSQVSSPTSTDLFDLLTIVHGYIADVGVNQFSGGWADYDDNATSSTPITITGGAGLTVLTNDTLGSNTNETKLPYGVAQLWDASTNKFDFTGLSVGDLVSVRVDLDIIIASTNTEVHGVLAMGSGASAFEIPLIRTTNYKATGTYNLPVYTEFYIGNTNMLENGGQIKIESDTTCTVTVNGWFIKATKVGV